MQFGVFSVSDITRDPVSGETPSEAERIQAAVAIATKTEEVGMDVFAIGEHFINLNFVTISVTKLTKRAEFASGLFGRVLGKADFEVFLDLNVHDIFNPLDLFWGHLLIVREVKTKPFFGDIATVLDDVVAKHVAQCLVHEVGRRVVFFVDQILAAETALERTLGRSL